MPHIISGFLTLEKENSVFRNKKLIIDWNYEKNEGIDPKFITEHSQRIFWWKCHKCGYEWKTSAGSRSSGRGCLSCAKQNRIKRSLSARYPKVVSIWNYEKNGVSPDDVYAQSNKKFWWKCDKGHEWETTPNHIARGQRCPVCSNKKIVIGINDLCTTHPYLLEEWDFERNVFNPESVGSGSNKKAYWICRECGRRWESMIYCRAVKGQGCKSCRNKKVK